MSDHRTLRSDGTLRYADGIYRLAQFEGGDPDGEWWNQRVDPYLGKRVEVELDDGIQLGKLAVSDPRTGDFLFYMFRDQDVGPPPPPLDTQVAEDGAVYYSWRWWMPEAPASVWRRWIGKVVHLHDDPDAPQDRVQVVDPATGTTLWWALIVPLPPRDPLARPTRQPTVIDKLQEALTGLEAMQAQIDRWRDQLTWLVDAWDQDLGTRIDPDHLIDLIADFAGIPGRGPKERADVGTFTVRLSAEQIALLRTATQADAQHVLPAILSQLTIAARARSAHGLIDLRQPSPPRP